MVTLPKEKSIPASRTAPFEFRKDRKDSPMSILFLGPRDPQTLLTSWEGPLQGMRDTTAMRILLLNTENENTSLNVLATGMLVQYPLLLCLK